MAPQKDHSILQTMRPNKSTTEISNSRLSGGAATKRVILTTSTKLNLCVPLYPSSQYIDLLLLISNQSFYQAGTHFYHYSSMHRSKQKSVFFVQITITCASSLPLLQSLQFQIDRALFHLLITVVMMLRRWLCVMLGIGVGDLVNCQLLLTVI